MPRSPSGIDGGEPRLHRRQSLAVETAPKERRGKRIAIETADSEIRLDPDSKVVTAFPALYGKARGLESEISRAGKDRVRSPFRYSLTEPFGTGRDFDDFAECVLAALRLRRRPRNGTRRRDLRQDRR